ncbi:MAG: C4-dicarboxylate transporter DctA [Geminicoccaceae bacterium]
MAVPISRGKPPLYRSLFFQVVIALALGIVIGTLWPGFAQSLKPLGDGFISLIKMIVGPIVFCVVVLGITGAGDLKKVGRVGLKAVVYFEILTTLALFIGIVLAYAFQPGVGMNINPASLDASAMSAYAGRVEQVQHGAVDFFLRLIPVTVVDAFAKGDILQVLLFAILFGAAASVIGERAAPVVTFIERTSQILFEIMYFIVKLAPLGVLGAIAFTVGKYGAGSLAQLGMLVLIFYTACLVFVLAVLGTILRLTGFSIFKFLRYIKDELMIVLGTASSDAVLPALMRKLEALGVGRSTVGLVMPTGYSFNLDGFSIYLTLAAVFIAQATNTPLSLTDLLVILGISMVTSKGAHGIPGSAIVILAATLSAIPALPVVGLVLVLAVDWFMGIGRAMTNMIGNSVATVVIGAWENDIDRERARQVLDGEVVVSLDAAKAAGSLDAAEAEAVA